MKKSCVAAYPVGWPDGRGISGRMRVEWVAGSPWNRWSDAHGMGGQMTVKSAPKARNDELSYLSTQVVFEYLRLRFGKYVDGLVFPSVQTGELGTNVVLFPEASRLSYEPPADFDLAYGPAPKAVPAVNRFGPPAKLMVVPDSIRFHKVTAIETKAKEYDNLYGLFMSELNRKRLGPAFY